MTPNPEAHPAFACVNTHLDALNAVNKDALIATLIFPHYRFTGTSVKIWETPETYLKNFHARAGDRWARSNWGETILLNSDERSAHLHLKVERYDADGSLICAFWSVWCVVATDQGWKVQARFSAAPE